MKLKRNLTIVIIFLICASIFFSIAIHLSLQNYRNAFQKTKIVDELVHNVFERRLLADDYVFNNGERAKLQWFAKQEQLNDLLRLHETIFQSQKERELIKRIQEGLKDSESVFKQIVELNEEESFEDDTSLEQKNRLASQLSVKAQETISAASTLDEKSTEEAEHNLERIIILFSIAASLFFLMLIVSFWIIWKGANDLEKKKSEDEAILGSIGDGVFAIDAQGKIVLFNKTAQVLTGFSHHEAVGKMYNDIFEFIFEKSGEKNDVFIKTALSGTPAQMGNHTLLKRKDKSTIPVADSAAPIIDANGKVSGAVVVFRDITKERELEKMKDEFVSIASHELRTPMGAIKAFVSMILAGDYGAVNENLKEPLSDIKTSTERLVNLVNDLLNVARIEAGRMKFHIVDADISDVIEEVVKGLEPLAAEKNLTLKSQIPMSNDQNRLKVQVDVDKVKQVLTNIVGNSLKFTDKGEITLNVQTHDDMVEVDISDTGEGIAKEDQEKLFGKFQQVGSGGDRPSGTGLGLYISREMIHKLGGELWIVKSELGKGTTFAFTLPAAESEKAKRVKADIEKEAEVHPDQK